MAERATLVLHVKTARAVVLKPAESGPLPAGIVRLYVEAKPVAALRGALPAQPVSYLVDTPAGAKGRIARVPKRDAIVFARPVEGKPGMLRLVAPDAEPTWSTPFETRTRAVLTELAAPGAVAAVTGVRSAMHVPGTLAGEGETQIFLRTAGEPLTISVVRSPDRPPAWTLSVGDLVDQSGKPPAHDTLAWYRLSCSLPASLPAGIDTSASDADRAATAEDYGFVLKDLGACPLSAK